MNNFNIYKASAGSGKTYTLVKEYVKKCISNTSNISQQSLLAITFTNKAAAEMKTRIISTLFKFSKAEKVDFFEDLKIELNYTDEQIIKKSKKALFDIIHYYSLFSVSTIDKFVHRVIRNFTYELNLPANFEVEMDSRKIIEESVFTLLDEVGLDEALTLKLLKFSEHKTIQEKYWDVEYDLIEFGKELFKDSFAPVLDQLLNAEDIQKNQLALSKKTKLFEKTIQSIYSSISALIKGIPEKGFVYKALPNYLQKIKKKNYLELDICNKSRLYNSIKKREWYSKKTLEATKRQIDAISDSLEEELNHLINFLDKNYAMYLFYKEYYNSLFFVSLLVKINQKINSNKRAKNLVHISEFNQIIHDFLNTTSAPFVYEKIGNRYEHHFIDEFQDTSIIQWNNLIPLIENSLASGGSCLLVGDGKQSIYRWRGGEVDQFLALCTQESSDENLLLPSKIHSLNTNRRSEKKIIEFNNSFFNFLSKNFDTPYKELYNKLSQNSFLKEEGYVEISFLESDNESSVLDKGLKKVYNCIVDIRNDNYNFSDIFILTRKNSEITTIATYLSERSIPVISSESLLLAKSETVLFLVNNIKLLLNVNNLLSRIEILEFLLQRRPKLIKGQSLSQFFKLHTQNTHEDFQKLLQAMGFNYDSKHYINLNLYELIENLIRDFKLKIQNNLFVTFFLDFILDFSTNQNNSIRDFLNYWELKKDILSIVIPSGINAVEIMTIHKAKGLEFPIVIFPFANWKEDLGGEKQWFTVPDFSNDNNELQSTTTLLPIKKEFEKWPHPFPTIYKNYKTQVVLDNINLLYVALTRAKSRMYIYTNSDYKKGNIYKYFEDYLKTKSTHLKTTFSMGKPTKNITKIKTSNPMNQTRFVSHDWRDRLRIKNKHTFDNHLQASFSIKWGHLIHEIMSEINSVADTDSVLSEYRQRGLISKESYLKIKNQILNCINQEQVSHLYAPNLNVFSEYSIVVQSGEVFRPDRVVVHSQKHISLVDYKTGIKRPEDYKQMKKYEQVLFNMGYENIDKYLIYFKDCEIEKLQ